MFKRAAIIAKELDKLGRYEEADYLTDILRLAASNDPQNIRLAQNALQKGIDAYKDNPGGPAQAFGAGINAAGTQAIQNSKNSFMAPYNKAKSIRGQGGSIPEAIGAGIDVQYRQLLRDAGALRKGIELLAKKVPIETIVKASERGAFGLLPLMIQHGINYLNSGNTNKLNQPFNRSQLPGAPPSKAYTGPSPNPYGGGLSFKQQMKQYSDKIKQNKSNVPKTKTLQSYPKIDNNMPSGIPYKPNIQRS